MRSILLSAIALAALAAGARAEPLALSDTQLDKVTAGGSVDVFPNGEQVVNIQPPGEAFIVILTGDTARPRIFPCTPGVCEGDVTSGHLQGDVQIHFLVRPAPA